jgi:hypothetical protein
MRNAESVRTLGRGEEASSDPFINRVAQGGSFGREELLLLLKLENRVDVDGALL